MKQWLSYGWWAAKALPMAFLMRQYHHACRRSSMYERELRRCHERIANQRRQLRELALSVVVKGTSTNSQLALERDQAIKAEGAGGK